MPRRECINTWDQFLAAGGDQVAISYRPYEPRSVLPAAYYVWRLKDGKEVQTDPGASWFDHGHKAFPCATTKAAKAEALAAAMEWATTTYGPRDWVRNRLGDYLDRAVNERFPLRKPVKKSTS